MQKREDTKECEKHKEIFRKRFNQLFVESGLSKTQFAADIGISVTTLNSALYDAKFLSPLTIIKICKTQNVESDWLLGLMDV